MNINKGQKGFSLVELGISLTIIAMVIASVIAGANLKDKFELNQVMDDIGNINNAVQEFRKIYNGYPGDMFDAEDKLGAADTDAGDGNNAIEESVTGTVDGTAANVNERMLFWENLAVAGLIEGSYNGQTDFMNSPISNGIYSARKEQTGGLIISLERDKTNPVALAEGILSTRHAWELDRKFDDGIPGTGVIRAVDGNTANPVCVDTGAYNLSNTIEESCVLEFHVEQ